jgi:hypothetical protein
MSTTKKVNMFNLNPLVIEIGEVIEKGLNKILSDHMDRYELLENTHKQIMRLPSIRQALNKHPHDLYSDDDTDEPVIHNNTCDKSTVELLEYKLEKLEQKYDTIVPVLDKILNKIISLDQEVKTLRLCENIPEVKSSSCNTGEKENIKIHFEEPSEESIEEESDDDVNPALITCSTVTLNKERETVTDEEIVKPEENTTPSDETTVTLEEDEEEEDDELSVGEELGEHEEVEGESEELSVEELEEVEGDSEAKTDDNVEEESEDNVDDDVEEEASIETETKPEEEEEDQEEEDEEHEEPVKQVVEEKEEDDEELFEIEIDDKTYCTTDDQNGFIWELTEDGEQGEKIGYFENGDAYFYEDEN